MEEKLKLVVMVQGGHPESETAHQKDLFESFGIPYVKLNWNASFPDPLATYTSKKKIGWSDGRQLLYELVKREWGEYDYYVFLDDDVVFEKKDIPRIVRYLTEWQPLCAGFRCWFSPKRIWTWDEQGIPPSVKHPIRFMVKDENHMFLHRSVMEHLFPLIAHGPGSMIWIVERIVHDVYQGMKNIRFPDVVVYNNMHRKRGPAHGPQKPQKHDRLVDRLKPHYKVPLLHKKRDKEHIKETNTAYGLEQVPRVHKGSMPLTIEDLQTVVDTSSDVWQGRRWIYEDYQNDIVRNR